MLPSGDVKSERLPSARIGASLEDVGLRIGPDLAVQIVVEPKGLETVRLPADAGDAHEPGSGDTLPLRGGCVSPEMPLRARARS